MYVQCTPWIELNSIRNKTKVKDDYDVMSIGDAFITLPLSDWNYPTASAVVTYGWLYNREWFDRVLNLVICTGMYIIYICVSDCDSFESSEYIICRRIYALRSIEYSGIEKIYRFYYSCWMICLRLFE